MHWLAGVSHFVPALSASCTGSQIPSGDHLTQPAEPLQWFMPGSPSSKSWAWAGSQTESLSVRRSFQHLLRGNWLSRAKLNLKGPTVEMTHKGPLPECSWAKTTGKVLVLGRPGKGWHWAGLSVGSPRFPSCSYLFLNLWKTLRKLYRNYI